MIIHAFRYKCEGYEVEGFISAPADYLDTAYPILIFNRGGNREFGKLVPELPASLSAYGYVVMASQYRGVAGGTGQEQFGGGDINDVLALIDISESLTFAQRGGVYMAGQSRGGMMTYIACRKAARITAAAVFAGISDLVDTYDSREPAMKRNLEVLIGGPPDALPEAYAARSAVQWADEIDVPLLIVHGGAKDWRVKTEQATAMAEQLDLYQKEYKLIIYEDADHSLSHTPAFDEMDAWFRAHPFSSKAK